MTTDMMLRMHASAHQSIAAPDNPIKVDLDMANKCSCYGILPTSYDDDDDDNNNVLIVSFHTLSCLSHIHRIIPPAVK